MSYAKFMEGVSTFARNAMDMFKNSGKAQDLAADIGNATFKVGEVAGNLGLKVANVGLAGAASVVDSIRQNSDEIADAGKSFLGGLKNAGKSGLATGKKIALGIADEANRFGQAAAGGVEVLDKMGLIKKADFKDSLVGYKATGAGIAAMAGISLIAGSGPAVKTYMGERQGRHDGQITRVTPHMTNPYDIANQMAYSQSGQSFANNAGATGDLVFALNNMRQ